MTISRVLICAILPLLCLRAQDDDKVFAELEGRVVNAATGEPIHKAVVTLSTRHAERETKLIGSTDTEGKFRFKRVPPGDYALAARRNGFQERSHGSVLALRASDHLQDIALRLPPAGAISGRVIDEDGDAIAGASVKLLCRMNFLGQNRLERCGREDVRTSGNGEYRFDGLAPGVYLVRATPDDYVQRSLEDQVVDSKGELSPLREVSTYYPSALLADDASPIRVSGGEEQGGIDVRLHRSKTFRIGGRVVGLESMPASDLKLYIIRVEGGTRWLLDEAKLTSNGEFSVDKLLPGVYELSLRRTGGIIIRGNALVELTHADRTEVTIRPYVTAQVKLRVVVEGRERTPVLAGMGYLRQNPLDQGTWCGFKGGVCVFREVEPGKYILDIRSSIKSYIKSVRSGEKRFNARAIDVADGDLALDVILSEATARIDGRVAAEGVKKAGDREDKLPVGVVLVSVTMAEEIPDLPRMASLDQYGQFSFRDLSPGNYRLFAVEGVEYAEWTNPDLVRELESKGTAVELRERDNLRAQPRPITKQEVSIVRKKLGLE